jgi:Fur family peroxide stress response transcriptional regulator
MKVTDMEISPTESQSPLIDALRASGMRVTPQRMAICEILARSKEHPSAQAIFEQIMPRFPTMSLATVYNTLDALTSLGAINELGDAGDGTAHYDADLSPHVNLACISCHRVIDLPSTHIQAVELEVEETSGYHLLGARVLYYGLCPECSLKKS